MPASALESRPRDRRAPPLLLAEAGAALIAASLAIRLLPFRTLSRMLDRRVETGTAASAAQAYWLRRSICAWSRRVPWRARCFEEGVAATLMLRRRSLASQFHYGASAGPQPLAAHVWVTSGDVPVVGEEGSERFVALLGPGSANRDSPSAAVHPEDSILAAKENN